jgi:hypothetical protein
MFAVIALSFNYSYNKYSWLVGGSSFSAAKAVMRLWFLWDRVITVTMVKLLKEALNLYMLLCGNNALK